MSKKLTEMIERQRQAALAATAQHQKALEEQAAFDKRRADAKHEAFLKTPEGKAWKERQDRIELAQRIDKAQIAYAIRSAKIILEGLSVDMVVKSREDIVPDVHRVTMRRCYKLTILPFEDVFRETKNLNCEPSWIITNDLSIDGVIAFCDNPMKAGQEARIVHVSPKSCIIRPKAMVKK